MKILLITPPLTQLNCPYPATPVLKGFLQSKNIIANQCDLGIELIDSIFNSKFLSRLFNDISQESSKPKLATWVRQILNNQGAYIRCIDPVMKFLRNEDPTLANRIILEKFLPNGPRFKQLTDTDWAFGAMGNTEKARYFSTLFIQDIADFIRETTCPNFELFRYAEKLCQYLPNFEPLDKELNQASNSIDRQLLSILDLKIKVWNPDIIAITVPFPGNLYGALKCGQFIKMAHPQCKTILGGGFISTELRNITSYTIFKYCDALVLDDGEPALLKLIDYFKGNCKPENLIQTFLPINQKVNLYNDPQPIQIPFAERGLPDYSDLPIQKYISLLEVANPMHKLWSDGRWNKLTLAHGCYWAKCAFCDTSLPYISHYEPAPIKYTLEKIKHIIKQTGQSGFHFTDEAAPPKVLRELSQEISKENLTLSWWTNVRFEKAFTNELCFLMSQAGCIAVSGGLEVASDRILKLINKGITLEQAAKSTANLTNNDIMVHAYLMYGFPSETIQETIDSLEVVRQFFNEGLIQSAFWHRYAMTVHSPSGINPEKYGAQKLSQLTHSFSNNEISFTDKQTIDLEMLGAGLQKATFNYMHGIGLDWPLKKWFTSKIPEPKVPRKLISNYLNS